jgi:hypothetical protein
MLESLRKIQVEWELSTQELALMAHVPEAALKEFLALSQESADTLPSVPAGLETAVPLVSVFRSLGKLRPDPTLQIEWLKQENSILEGQVPIQVMMMSPAHLSWVAYTLDSAVRQAQA